MDGLRYAWIDTCCIDKSSSAELSEAINSMYQWYSQAAFCYVYLEDLFPNESDEAGLSKCRWITRGWTLQELLAPKSARRVRFYDMTWNYRGSKVDFVDILSTCTGIQVPVLSGRVKTAECSIAERMSWASKRTTTRVEDTAYCLLGIFNVNMPLLYGEGMKAFRRLQEEIIKRNNDLTIFAWEYSGVPDKTAIKLFAEEPTAFVNSSSIRPFRDDFEDFSITNKGLHMSGEAPLREATIKIDRLGRRKSRYALFVGSTRMSGRGMEGGIYLRKIGPKIFFRDLTLPLAGFFDLDYTQMRTIDDISDYYILTDPHPTISYRPFRNLALHVPSNDTLKLLDAVPETLWDVTDNVFLKPKPYEWIRYPMVIAVEFRCVFLGENIGLVVLCQYKEGDRSPTCKVFWKGMYPHEETLIFHHQKNRQESINWSQFEIDAPHLLKLSNETERIVGRRHVMVSASFEKRVVPSVTDQLEMFSLKLDITQGGGTEAETGGESSWNGIFDSG